jgi:ABC-type xylose transport system permease subunit
MLKDILPHNLIKRRVDAAASPVTSYMLIGVGMALSLLLIAGLLFLFLIIEEKISGSVGGAGGIIGFIVVPIVAIAGAPWTISTVYLDRQDLFFISLVAGPLINGALIGAAYGFFFPSK